ncbi:MAG: serine/threonine-protein kinase [Planctomycetota bacterium]
MQVRCAGCGRIVTLVATGVLPDACPHCAQRPVPERIGSYCLERLIAAGGMGEVYFARHEDLGTPVALKLLPPPVAEDVAALRERFAREARLQSSIDHPGVVRVFACDVHGDRPYLVLEFVHGRSLRELLREGPLPVREAARIAAAVADVLAAAHARGVLHRDIKPENVLRGDDGAVRVLDFGIARARDGEAPVTRTGEIVGTPQYMAPEQLLLAGDEVDERCDVHALGVLAFELLTGQPPFQGANVFAVLKLVESLVPRPVSAQRPEVPAAVDGVVARALAKDREARYASAAEFGRELAAAAGVAGGGDVAGERRSPWGVAIVLGMIGAAMLLLWLSSRTLERWFGGPGHGGRVAAVAEDRFAVAERTFAAGEFQQAIVAFERLPGEEARQRACLSWLAAYVAVPLAVDAPAFWSCCDEVRRRRLFGEDAEGVEPPPLLAAMRSLAGGDGPAAWRAVQPVLADGGGGRVVQTVALLAAHAACHDRRALRGVAARFGDAEPVIVELLAPRVASDRDLATRGRVMRTRAARLSADGGDQWLCELLAAGLDPAAAPERLRVLADVAWRNGGGEAAAVWFVGGRLRQAMRGGRSISRQEIEGLHTALDASPIADAPAVLPLRLMLDLQHGSAEAFEVQPPLPPGLPAALAFARVWRDRGPGSVSVLKCLLRGDSAVAADELAAPFAADLSAEPPGPAASWLEMRRALLAGVEADPAVVPWSGLAGGELRERWLEEVCGGVQ